MGMRCDQYIGLTEEGQNYIDKHAKVIGAKVTKEVYESGEEKVLSTYPIYDVSIYGEFRGCYNPLPLKQYVAKNGSVFSEDIQASPWSSGPMIFMALKDENGEWIEETLWNEDEIEVMY